MTKRFDPAESDLPPNSPAHASGEQVSSEELLNDESTRGSQREQHISGGEQVKQRTTARSRRGRSGARSERETPSEAAPEEIIQLPERSEVLQAEQDEEAEAVAQLQSQGFTPDEAIRLIHVSGRAATSREAREAEATLRRLRFTRWLIEHGLLDEFSA